MIRAVGVVIPAHDEETLLADCIESVLVARDALPDMVEARVVVVLDACTDGSEAIVRSFDGASVTGISVNCRNVGRARHAGILHVLERLGEAALDRTWIATTDADSRVPSTWLEEHVAFANAGADAVAGVIRIEDWGSYCPEQVQAFNEFYAALGTGDAHGHVHGANLGIRADAYAAARGFAPIDSGEDHSLFRDLRHAGKRVVSTRQVSVTTSARLTGRAPRGFADFLRSFAEERSA